MQYRSVTTIWSAVSMTHVHIEGIPEGERPLISQLLKGMYNLHPPQPRYSTTWDADIVIRYLQSLGNNVIESTEPEVSPLNGIGAGKQGARVGTPGIGPKISNIPT